MKNRNKKKYRNEWRLGMKEEYEWIKNMNEWILGMSYD